MNIVLNRIFFLTMLFAAINVLAYNSSKNLCDSLKLQLCNKQVSFCITPKTLINQKYIESLSFDSIYHFYKSTNDLCDLVYIFAKANTVTGQFLLGIIVSFPDSQQLSKFLQKNCFDKNKGSKDSLSNNLFSIKGGYSDLEFVGFTPTVKLFIEKQKLVFTIRYKWTDINYFRTRKAGQKEDKIINVDSVLGTKKTNLEKPKN